LAERGYEETLAYNLERQKSIDKLFSQRLMIFRLKCRTIKNTEKRLMKNSVFGVYPAYVLCGVVGFY